MQGSISNISRNPFEIMRPITDVSIRVSRSDVVKQVKVHLSRGEFVSILAPRQTGKTTLLHELAQSVGNCVYLDFVSKSYRSLEEVFSDLLAKVKAVNPTAEQPNVDQVTPREFFAYLPTTKSLTFLIDEIRESQEVAVELLRTLRSYYIESRGLGGVALHNFVFAGSSDLSDLTLEYNPEGSPFNIAHEVYLRDFDGDEVRSLVRRLAGERFSECAMDDIYRYTRGQPFLVQYLCFHLYDDDPHTIERRLANFGTLLEQFRLEDTALVQSMIYHVWNQPQQPQETRAILKAVIEGQRVPFTISNKMIRDLLLRGCLVSDRGNCAIRNPIYEAVLRKNITIGNQARFAQADVRAFNRPRSFDDYMAKLMNFDGWVLVTVSGATDHMPYDAPSRTFSLSANSNYLFEVKVSKEVRPPDDLGLVKSVRVEGGQDPVEPVDMVIRVESFYELGLGDEQVRAFPPNIENAIETYRFPIKTNDPSPQPVQVFVNIYQNVTLIESVQMFLRIS